MLGVVFVLLVSIFGLLSAFFSGEHHGYYTDGSSPEEVLRTKATPQHTGNDVVHSEAFRSAFWTFEAGLMLFSSTAMFRP